MLAEIIERESIYHTNELKQLYAQPLLAAVIRAAVDVGDGSTTALRSALEALFAKPDWLIEAGRRWLDHLLAGEFLVPPAPGALADGGCDLVKTALIFKNDKLLISLQSFDSRALTLTRNSLAVADHVILTGRTSLSRIVNGGRLSCELLEFGALTATIDLDRPLSVGGTRRFELDAASPTLIADGRCSATRFLDSAGDPLILSATILSDALPFRCAVDAKTGRIETVHAARDVDNMTRTLMTVLRQLDDGERGVMLRKFFRHEAHFVRWHAMREFAGMHGAAAVPALHDALAGEPSGYVRRGIESLITALARNRAGEETLEDIACP
jgi:hypothetical protein